MSEIESILDEPKFKHKEEFSKPKTLDALMSTAVQKKENDDR
jgi:hypothetical protein